MFIRPVSFLLFVFVISTFVSGISLSATHSTYTIIDYTKFIAISNEQEKKIVAHMRAQEGYEIFVKHFMVKACKGLTAIVQKYYDAGNGFGIITAGNVFIDSIASQAFAFNKSLFGTLDILGDRATVQQHGISNADLLTKITHSYNRVVLATAVSLDEDLYAQRLLFYTLQQQIPNLDFDPYACPIYALRDASYDTLVEKSIERAAGLNAHQFYADTITS